MPLRDLLLFAVFAVMVALTFRRTIYGLATWTIFTYAAPHHFTWGPSAHFSFVMMIACLTMALALLKRDVRLPSFPPNLFFWGSLAVWISLTTAAAYDFDEALPVYLQTIKIMLLGFFTILLVKSRSELMLILGCIAGSVLFFGIKGGIFVLLTGGEHRVYGPPDHFMGANNGLGVALLMTIPFAWFLAYEVISPWLRRGLLVAIPLCALSILATYSRGAALALFLTAVYWLWRTRRRAIAIGSVVLLPLLAVLAMPDKFVDRMETIQNVEEDRSAQQRLEMWEFGFKVAKRNILGGGFGIFPQYQLYSQYNLDMEIMNKPKTAHSIYFEALGQHGFIGLFLFFSMGFATYARFRRHALRGPTQSVRRFGLAAEVSLVAYALGGAFINKAFEWPFLFQLVAFSVVAGEVLAQQSDQATDTKETPRQSRSVRARGPYLSARRPSQQ